MLFVWSYPPGCVPLSISYFLATLLSSVASMISAYLLYMQFQVHNKICLPCLAIYFIHVLLFLVLTLRWTTSGSAETPQSSKDSQKSPKQADENVKGNTDKERSSSDEASRQEAEGVKVKNSSGKATKRKK